MDEKKIIKKWVMSLIVIGMLDYVWLGIIQRENWKRVVYTIQGEEMRVRMESAIVAYIILACIPVYINITYRKENGFTKESAIIRGGIIGFFVYGIFNLTNHAIFKNYDKKVAIYDTAWGAFLISITTYIISVV